MLPPHLQNKSVIDRFMNLKKKFPDISPKGYVHVFHGELHKEGNMWLLKGGMHTEEGLQNFLKANKEFIKNCPIEIIECEKRIRIALVPEELFLERQTFESSVAIINGKQYQGVKTLWPKHYTPEMILEESRKITSIKDNLFASHGNKSIFHGFTKDGFKVKTVVNALNNQIITTHPMT